MKGIMVLICVLFSVMNARQTEHKNKEDPCASIYIKKAQKEGLRSLSILEFRSYILDIKLCEDIIGTSRPFDAIEKKQFESDFEKSNRMRGWTSSFAYCTMIILVSSYLNLYFSN